MRLWKCTGEKVAVKLVAAQFLSSVCEGFKFDVLDGSIGKLGYALCDASNAVENVGIGNARQSCRQFRDFAHGRQGGRVGGHYASLDFHGGELA